MKFQSLRTLRQEIGEKFTRGFWRRRALRRESQQITTNEYWHRRERSANRQFRVLRLRHQAASSVSNLRTSIGIIRWAFIDTLKSSAIGVLLLGAILAIEALLVRDAGLQFLQLKPGASFVAFPGLATQVLAALLGFYLATVGIVLGNAYQDVADSVRQLILRNAVTGRYLRLVGMSIGVGLAIVLLQNLQIVSFGYLSIGGYTLLVAVSGWAFGTLAIGAFNLLNPISLGSEPLRGLYRAIARLDSKGFHLDDAVLRVTASRADNELSTLAELIRLTEDRRSVSRVELANMVGLLLSELQIYARKKHHLSPNSGWFLRETSYPRWVETDGSAMSMALETSAPLESRQDPKQDWLERRVAFLVSAAIEACTITDDKEQALLIVRKVGLTAQVLAEVGGVEEATDFARIVAEQCRDIDSSSDTLNIVLADFPVVFSNILMGWRNAIDSWPEEIQRAVDTTSWGNPKTRTVQIRGPARVRQAAQTLLYQIESERRIEGERITPDWHLRSVLAGECIISIREFLNQFPNRVGQVLGFGSKERLSPISQVLWGTQTLQMLRRAEYIVVESLTEIVADLESIREGYNVVEVPEIDSTARKIAALRSVVLDKLAKTLAKLEPRSSRDEPDYFGEALYRLIFYAEQAIADGDEELIESIFPSILSATMRLHGHMLETYRPPTYQVTPGTFGPFLDIIDLSGIAIIYESIRGDQSAEPVRQAWRNWVNNGQAPQVRAVKIMDTLDYISRSYDPMGVMRFEWEKRATQEIINAGYAVPEPPLFGIDEIPKWDAPPLIRLMGVSEYMPSFYLKPYVLFAAKVISSLSGEDEETVRERPGLKRYFEFSDHQKATDSAQDKEPDESSSDECSSEED